MGSFYNDAAPDGAVAALTYQAPLLEPQPMKAKSQQQAMPTVTQSAGAM